jgi:hypothetical protein
MKLTIAISSISIWFSLSNYRIRVLKNLLGVLRWAQDERAGFDIIDGTSVLLSLPKHEALEAFQPFFRQPAIS